MMILVFSECKDTTFSVNGTIKLKNNRHVTHKSLVGNTLERHHLDTATRRCPEKE